MEEVIAIILGALLEALVEVLVYVPWDVWLGVLERRRQTPTGPFEFRLGAVVLVGTVIGLVLGGFSMVTHGRTMLPWPWLRLANLALAPVISGTLARSTAAWRRHRGEAASPRQHFWFAFALTATFTAVRFAYGVRPK